MVGLGGDVREVAGELLRSRSGRRALFEVPFNGVANGTSCAAEQRRVLQAYLPPKALKAYHPVLAAVESELRVEQGCQRAASDPL